MKNGVPVDTESSTGMPSQQPLTIDPVRGEPCLRQTVGNVPAIVAEMIGVTKASLTLRRRRIRWGFRRYGAIGVERDSNDGMTSRPQHPRQLLDGPSIIRDVLQHMGRKDQVERAIGKRQGGQVGPPIRCWVESID